MDLVLSRPLAENGDVTALTFSRLDLQASQSFRKPSLALRLGLVDFTTLMPGQKSHVFNLFDNGSGYTTEKHIPGTEFTGQQPVQKTVTVTIDDIDGTAENLPLEDMSLSHFNDIARAADKVAYAGGREFELTFWRMLTLAARTAAVTGIHDGGNRVERTGQSTVALHYPQNSTGADNAFADLMSLALLMDKDDIPSEPGDRLLACLPDFYTALCHHSKLSRDFVPMPEGTTRRVLPQEYGGFELIKTQNLPSTNYTSGLSKYQGDFRIEATSGRPVGLALYRGGMTPDGKPSFGAVRGIQSIAPTLRVIDDPLRLRTQVQWYWRWALAAVDVWCAGEIAVLD